MLQVQLVEEVVSRDSACCNERQHALADADLRLRDDHLGPSVHEARPLTIAGTTHPRLRIESAISHRDGPTVEHDLGMSRSNTIALREHERADLATRERDREVREASDEVAGVERVRRSVVEQEEPERRLRPLDEASRAVQ